MATKNKKRTRTPIVRNADFCARAKALYQELGSADAVAENMQTSRMTVIRAIKEGPIVPRLLRKAKPAPKKKTAKRRSA